MKKRKKSSKNGRKFTINVLSNNTFKMPSGDSPDSKSSKIGEFIKSVILIVILYLLTVKTGHPELMLALPILQNGIKTGC